MKQTKLYGEEKQQIMNMPLTRQFDEICSTGCAIAGYTSGLCGEWTKERFILLAEELGTDAAKITVANQHHTDEVHVMGMDDAGKGYNIPQGEDFYDAMITDQPGLMLSVHTADCVPVVIVDPMKKNIGIAHSGWAGSSKRIAGKTVRKMIDVYGSNPSDIIICMGPYNHSCCYEVGEDVLGCFRSAFSDSECEQMFKKKEAEGKYLLDLGKAISIALCQEGVLEENIHDSGYCTYHTDEYSSWRLTRYKKHQILTYLMI